MSDASAPPIEVRGLTKYYGDVRGAEDLTFAVERGERFGFLGPNGAGKPTTIRMRLGFLDLLGDGDRDTDRVRACALARRVLVALAQAHRQALTSPQMRDSG